MANRYAVSVDVGGTFTDFVLFDMDAGQAVAFHKVLTDAARPARAVVAGWRELLQLAGASSAEVEYAVHSTTIVTNAIVERRGVKTALLTTRGFRDVLEIGIEQIYDIYDLFAPYPPPLIPRELRREVAERISRDGAVLTPLDEAEVAAVVDELAAEGAGAIAVSLIHAYRNPAHERRIGELIAARHPEIAVSLSSRVAPLIGEYERTSTVAADAYVKPLLRRYIADLLAQLRELGFERELYMMLSSGGISTAQAAMEFPIRLLESGPAAGAFAASFYGGLAGQRQILSLDMGGTTAKACLIEDGLPGIAHMLEADRVHRFKPGSGLPIMAPTVDLIEIGAGGGSIAHVNNLGLLQVGPQSAESNPGPASYGLGGERPTVTDANVLLGYLDPGYFLGGRMTLRPELAAAALDQLSGPLDLERRAAAWGVHAIVNENMAQAARTHLIERNRDPRDVALVAFGGAGPAHAVEVARILGIRQILVPFGAGVSSAVGALTAPMALPFARSYMTPLESADWALVRRLYDDMRSEARDAFAGVAGADEVVFQLAADMRFAGQYHELRVPLPPDADAAGAQAAPRIAAAFQQGYEAVYGRAPGGLAVEVLNWHLTAELPRAGFQLAAEPLRERAAGEARKGERAVYFDRPKSGEHTTPVYDRYRLEPGAAFPGPAIIEEREATIVVPPGYHVTVDGYRNVVITAREAEEEGAA
ncbi:MAG TPA: hydantoinase/oxoprolinase family protein [Thermomicrobiaceae bacterium]|nr:hydantoinase/oxoprolinase family protein [Thermomicrobiaceae bacterium]